MILGVSCSFQHLRFGWIYADPSESLWLDVLTLEPTEECRDQAVRNFNLFLLQKGLSQCRWGFPDCYDLIREVRLKVTQAPDTLTCQEVTLSLACTETMEQFDPCHALEFENITFDRAVVILNQNKASLCAVDEKVEKKSECETIFPDCYVSLAKAGQNSTSCSEAKQRQKCLKSLTISMSCRDSPHAQKFADMRKADSAYLLEHCTKSVPTPTPSPKPTKLYTTDAPDSTDTKPAPDTASALHPSLMAIALVALSFSY
ncbi:hypothetical protein RRG08_001798 [Elysia crispata]|uniref:Uncharacterized protein n=1 Tax=Elysia crispata TaxID=231223 RepID=A0AAE1ANH6_9GAST|nr:hypothetical protein RRG08_001798 [Elysia crispata]